MFRRYVAFAILLFFILTGGFALLMGMNHVSYTLAYPPATYASPAYPAPGTSTPTPFSTYLPPEPITGTPYWVGPTWTPWPSPTPHPFIVASGPRQGVAGANRLVPVRDYFGSWGYTWADSPPDVWPTVVEHVPMAYGNVIDPNLPSGTATAEWAVLETRVVGFATARAPVDPPTSTPPANHYYLVFNECEHNDQCNAHPEDAARFYKDFVDYMATIDPYARLIVGGVNANPCGIKWLQEFTDQYVEIFSEPVPRAGWHFHLYPEVVASSWNPTAEDPYQGCQTWETPPTPTPPAGWIWAPERLNFETWKDDAENILSFILTYGDMESDEIWITEMGCPHSDDDWDISCRVTEGFMREYTSQMLAWLNNEGRWVDRYAWYTDWLNYVEHFTLLYEFPTPTPTPSQGGFGPMAPAPTMQGTPSTIGNFYAGVTPAAIVKPDVEKIWLPVVSK